MHAQFPRMFCSPFCVACCFRPQLILTYPSSFPHCSCSTGGFIQALRLPILPGLLTIFLTSGNRWLSSVPYCSPQFALSCQHQPLAYKGSLLFYVMSSLQPPFAGCCSMFSKARAPYCPGVLVSYLLWIHALGILSVHSPMCTNMPWLIRLKQPCKSDRQMG